MGCEQQQYQHCPGWRRENRDRIDDEGRKENKKVGLHCLNPIIRARPKQRAQNNFGITAAEERTIMSC
jgi:hypothetical protein